MYPVVQRIHSGLAGEVWRSSFEIICMLGITVGSAWSHGVSELHLNSPLRIRGMRSIYCSPEGGMRCVGLVSSYELNQLSGKA